MALDKFKTGSGLVDEFDYTITDAVFAHDVKIADGEIPLLKLTGRNSVTGNEEGIWLKAGANVEIIDGGAAVTFIKGTTINQNTQYGKFMDAFVACDAGAKAADDRDMDPLRAASWIGLTLSLERVIKKFTIDGQEREGQEWVIHDVTYDGAAPTAAKDTTTEQGVEIPAAKGAKAAGIARAVPDYETYYDRVYEEIPGLVGAAYEDALTGREFFEAAREGGEG